VAATGAGGGRGAGTIRGEAPPRRRLGVDARGRLSGRAFGLAAVALAAVCSVAAFGGCVDLFHSTDFSTCSPDAGTCSPPAESGTGDATRPHDGGSGKDAAKDGARGAGDATLDGHPGTHDAGGDGQTVGDGGTLSDGGGHPPDAGVDSGTNFCTAYAEPGSAAAAAQHACLWLGACAGNNDLNEYGTCYPNALMAYDCNLNPNQQVRGALHAYWDALRDVTSCAEVMAAIFPDGASCDGTFSGCVEQSGSNKALDVVATCVNGVVISAVNCEMAGYTCDSSTGTCVLSSSYTSNCQNNPPAACDDSGVLHACRRVENNPDPDASTSLVDIGRNCTFFGSGTCLVDNTSSPNKAGCVPNDASVACTPSPNVMCGDGGVATGCATGYLEKLNCPEFDAGNHCSVVDGGWFASSNTLIRGCYNPFNNGAVQADNTCTGTNAFQDYVGPLGNVRLDCLDAGLDACLPGGEGRPRCGPPPP
jgi:hypothetical protein